jgi:hypothetical protein
MPRKPKALRDWHRLFGLLLTDFFTGSPFTVELERDLSLQQQRLDVVIVRRSRRRFAGRLPDGLDGLRVHNLLTFKSHREALDAWAMKELIGHSVAYRKLVSPAPNRLLPEAQFGLYAICARFPQQLSGQVPWQPVQAGVYDCRWGTDTIRVLVAGELPREAQNAPLHMFSTAPELQEFGRGAYRWRSEKTSLLLEQLFDTVRDEGLAMYTMDDFIHDYIKEHFPRLTPREQREVQERLSPEIRREILLSAIFEKHREEGLAVSNTIEDFIHDYIKEHFTRLTPQEQREALERLSPEHLREVLQSLPPEARLAGLSEAQLRQRLDQLAAGGASQPSTPRRKRPPEKRSPGASRGKNPKKVGS